MVLTAAEPTLATLERALLLTLAYSDVFDYPLTADELRRYLSVPCSDGDFDDALAALAETRLSRDDGLYCLRGREEILARRRRRAELAERRWQAARRFASWLAGVPFLRMVAVCGSQAVDNGDADGDVDLFLVTEPGRLWLVQSATMVLRRLGHLRFGIDICPNFLTAGDRLEIEDHNLYLAREIAQAVPLWGEDAYQRFLEANRWVARFLPQLDVTDRRRRLLGVERPRLARALERLLGGRAGHLLDRAVHRTLLLYYRVRLWRRGWRKADIERAYRADRQELITGGYAGAIAHRFLERARETLAAAGHDVTVEELREGFFEAPPRDDVEADPHFAGLFAARYGGEA